MHRRRPFRLPAALLALALLLAVSAQALTPEEARTLLERHYIDPPSEEVLSQPTIADMLDALGDPYTSYFTPEEYAAFLSSMRDTVISGVGLSAQMTADGLLVESVIAGSPAEEAGIAAGDLVTAIDGGPTAGLEIAAVTALLRGEAGTQVEVSLLRDGQARTLTLTRQAIVIPATSTELLDGHIGLITCTTFGGETLGHFTEGITANSAQADRWILDLTGNGGGTVEAAVGAAGCFTGPARLAYLRDAEGRYGAYPALDPALTQIPVIVLTDGGTASSSELFAAAVRDQDAGIVVGSRTYGKGVAQALLDQDQYPDYFPDGDALKVTSYRFFSAIGSTTDTVGVIPHLLVDGRLSGDVARLLSASGPDGDTAGLLRVDLEYPWYVNLEQALSEEFRPAFAALLEALPPSARIWTGTGGPDGWAPAAAEELAEACGLDIASRRFTDTAASPYAGEIDTLAAYLILEGDGSGAFRPAEPLTRAQLCVLLAHALNCRTPQRESAFSDVSMDDWYGPSVNALAGMGLISGDGGGCFRPGDPVTHEQLITILGRLGENLNMFLNQAALDCTEADLDQTALAGYADWAREGVWLLSKSQIGLFGRTVNLLWADPEAIDPGAAATREETAALVCRLLTYIGILPA